MDAVTIQKDDVDDVVAQLDESTVVPENTAIEDLSILISSLEGSEEDKKENNIENNNLINNNIIINNNKNNKLIKKTQIELSIDTWSKFTNDYLHKKHPGHIPEEIFQAEIESVFLNVVSAFNSEAITTSSTSLLFEGQPPRADCLKRLSSIASDFAEQEDFPYLTLQKIKQIIGENVGKDERTRRKYLNCIKQYIASIYNDYGYLRGYNVSTFYHLIPNNSFSEDT